MNPLSVSELNAQIKTLIESTFLEVYIEGEVSGFKPHTSGHIYFTLKDNNSSIKCIMFKGNAKSLQFSPKDGQKVLIKGVLNVYAIKGEYQILCHSIISSGQGELALLYQQLKDKLKSKGYFDSKKPIPQFPKKIAIITSLSGAALQDMLRVSQERWNLTKFVVFDTLVQGVESKFDIAKNIAYTDSFFGSKDAFDIIIISRGGGSIEDLWAFNEEIVADAIFKAKTPIVSAVGHEVDFVISDFVADLRAPTPSACMQIILPDSKEWLQRIADSILSFDICMAQILDTAQQHLFDLSNIYQSISYESKMRQASTDIMQNLEFLHISIRKILNEKSKMVDISLLHMSFQAILRQKYAELEALNNELQAYNPRKKVQNGFAQILSQGKIKPLTKLTQDEIIELCDGERIAKAKILEILDPSNTLDSSNP